MPTMMNATAAAAAAPPPPAPPPHEPVMQVHVQRVGSTATQQQPSVYGYMPQHQGTYQRSAEDTRPREPTLVDSDEEQEPITTYGLGENVPLFPFEGGSLGIQIVEYKKQSARVLGSTNVFGMKLSNKAEAVYYVILLTWRPSRGIETDLPEDQSAPYSWTLLRRYSEFEALQKKLEDLVPSPSALSRLPAKHGWSHSPSFLRKRQIGLEGYLQRNIEADPRLLEVEPMAAFLNLKFGVSAAKRHFLKILREGRGQASP